MARKSEFTSGRPALPRGLETPGRARPKSLTHKLSLAAVWLAVATSAIVFSEPAPTDALMLGLIVLLPVVGMVRFNPAIIAFAALLLVINAFGYVATIGVVDYSDATKHTAVSLYLSLAAVVIAAFVARRPVEATRLLLGAQLAGALIAAAAGIAGYFDLVPGGSDLLTRFGRASGTFKDPNVLGSFLVPAIVYALHLWMNRPLHKGLGYAAALAVLSLALLLTFSRGAWAIAAIAAAIYLYVAFVTSNRNGDRVRIIGLGLAGILALIPLVAFAVSSDGVGELFAERASLTQSYDVGPEGRFGGQRKALDLIAENPFGIGAGEFPKGHHPEDVHNVYLSMYLNAGWIGGSGYLALVAGVLVLGFARSFRTDPTGGLLLVALASLAAIIFEGAIIDTDHWRHFYLLLGVVVGLLASPLPRPARPARIVRDRRPILLRQVVLLAPDRRGARILRPVSADPAPPVAARITIDLRALQGYGASKRKAKLVGPVRPKRPPRLLGSDRSRLQRPALPSTA